MRVVLFANSAIGKFCLGSATDLKERPYCLPTREFPYDVECRAEELTAYRKVDSTVTIWKLFKATDVTDPEPPEMIGYAFQFFSKFPILDWSNALLARRRDTLPQLGLRSKLKELPEAVAAATNEELERIASSASLLFRTEDFFVYGSPNYGILITAASNDALEEARSNSI